MGEKRGTFVEDRTPAEPRLDFDMHTTAVLLQVMFDHQKRWQGELAQSDVEEIAQSPSTGLGDVLARFKPEIRFALAAETRDELVKRLTAAGCSIAQLEALKQGWEIMGEVRALGEFSPARMSAGIEHFKKNVLAELGAAEQLYANAASAATGIDFGEGRQDTLDALDVLIELLDQKPE